MITNPILRGFNPDPSIIRVGEDYYIATSTFEWFPGVQIHHSKDLVHWELVARPLHRVSQLDMLGTPDSCGVWAPCLTYDQGTFYLVYSNVRSFDGVWKDTPNYLVTTNDVLGDWSEPIFLGGHGFDGSLFHDIDGRKWYTSLLVDHRKGKFFGGIILQEYDVNQQQLIGPVHHIFAGSALGITEGPHLYQKNGYYYLLTAEGGTEYGHAATIARSKHITGPYELHPQTTILTTRDMPDYPLQRAGHGDIVEAPSGDWYIVFLVGRPISPHRRCIMGRETAIEEIVWKDDHWPYLKSGLSYPRVQVPIGGDHHHPPNTAYVEAYHFEENTLPLAFQALRIPIDPSWVSLVDKPGYLRLYGRESLNSLYKQSLVARRIQHLNLEVTTCLTFQPTTFQQMAGLVFYYNTIHWIYLHVMGHEDGKSAFLQLMVCDNYETKELLYAPIPVDAQLPIYLKATLVNQDLQCYYAVTPNLWHPIGPVIDASILSDDYVREGGLQYRPAFTGAFVGMCCQDLTGNRQYSDFKFFSYKEMHPNH